jgi:hypothetical protein
MKRWALSCVVVIGCVIEPSRSPPDPRSIAALALPPAACDPPFRVTLEDVFSGRTLDLGEPVDAARPHRAWSAPARRISATR